ncbi:MFS transporter [Desulfosediminicola ganghwensis]|uniref:MFS transporter n=1 Tax=Desulfosediminicola ganghwensis TaxID=2569540 RepID=UPI00142EE188|nr:MFS transporter [Desulfosediminicola ganghwensis]
MNTRILSFLFAGHMVNDLHQGAIPALLPFLILRHDMSYSAAAVIVFAFTGTATIMQPLFGYLSDRFGGTWTISAGVMLTSLGFALIGVAPDYGLLIAAVIVSGLGSALFHPDAAGMVNYASGEAKATAMSIFGVGGVLGFLIGPFAITAAVLAFGLKGVAITMLPASLVAVLIILQHDRLRQLRGAVGTTDQEGESCRNDNWLAFTALSLTIIGKSVIYYGLFTFIPLYWTDVLQQSQIAGAAALTVFSAGGVFGNLLGGRLADLFGHKKIVVGGCCLLIPLLPALLLVENVFVANVLIATVGALLLFTYGPTVVLGQEYLPNHIGFSSGMTLGVAFSIGGMVAPLLGNLADQEGLSTALKSIIFLPILVTAIASTLPTRRSSRKISLDGRTGQGAVKS